tara:strand:- start:23062 stop:23184 length:123 start_codon:yes stop_codon:yes gene_type:complete
MLFPLFLLAVFTLYSLFAHPAGILTHKQLFFKENILHYFM